MKKLLIEYHRVSDPTQLAKTGMAQQKAPSELIEKLCREHNLEVFPTVFDDRGISAFKGTKVRNGYEELKELLASGEVHPESVLVVLNQDRLSRQAVFDAQVELMGILKHCRIYVMHDNRLMDRNSENIMGDLILSLANAQRAFSESDAKSKRTKGAVLNKIKAHQNGVRGVTGKPINLGMGKLPWWYSSDPVTKEIEPIEEAVAAARTAVELFIKGESVYGVKRHLDEHHQLPEKLSKKAKNGWSIDVVRRMHKSPNLVGEFSISVDGVEHQVTDYLEPIIDRNTYLKFLKVRGSKSTVRRAKDGAVALFGGLGHCRGCGGTLTNLSDKGRISLRCTNALNRRVACPSPVSITGNWFKDYMVNVVLRYLGTKQTTRPVNSEADLKLLDQQIAKSEQKLEQLLEVLVASPSGALGKLVQSQEQQLLQLQTHRDDLEMKVVTEVFDPLEKMPENDLELRDALLRLIKDMRISRIGRGTVLVSIFTKNDINVSVAFKSGVLLREGYLSGTSDGDAQFIDDAQFHKFVADGELDLWLSNQDDLSVASAGGMGSLFDKEPS